MATRSASPLPRTDRGGAWGGAERGLGPGLLPPPGGALQSCGSSPGFESGALHPAMWLAPRAQVDRKRCRCNAVTDLGQ